MNIINSSTKIIVGKNSLDYLKDYKNKNILIVTDKFLAHSELIDSVLKICQRIRLIFLMKFSLTQH